ncbi:MAG: hypothetical protein IH988_04220 [Planctomycetes bacterium]|nr:hypothetical protein [Planctomycetota bacterium]
MKEAPSKALAVVRTGRVPFARQDSLEAVQDGCRVSPSRVTDWLILCRLRDAAPKPEGERGVL